jgi:hypothetical protein
VKYSSVGSSIRFPNGIAFSESTKLVNTTPLRTTKLTGLYPDSSFNVQVAATNNSNLTGDYTGISNGITTSLTPLAALTSITFTYGQYSNSNTTYIYYITNGSTTNSIAKNLLASGSLSVINLTMPIHRESNRGKLQGSGTIMTFTTNLNGSDSLSIDYQGFPVTNPSSTNNTAITMTPQSVVDNYSGSAGSSGSPGSNNQNLGFYLNARMNMTIQNTKFIARTDANVVNFSQSFATSPVTNSSGSFSFYYDEPISSAPTVSLSLSSFGINSSYFKKISGINVLYTTTQITIDASATNMGKYFYSSPPLSYTCRLTNSSGTVVRTFDESSLTNVVKATYYPNNFLLSPIVFNSRFDTNNLASSYATQLYLSVIANNVHSASSSVWITRSVIVDGPSNTLVYTTFPTSIPTATSSALAGYRVWSATTVSNNCPDLSYNGIFYKDISYNNAWDITSTSSTPGNYNVTTELLVSNGLFRSKSSEVGYLDYTSSLYNSTIDYSQISASGFRFATFCWKLQPTVSQYSNLSFTINSISPTPTRNSSGLLLINSRQIQVLYFFQDQNQPSTFSNPNANPPISTINSVWIDGNNSNNPVSTGNYFDTNNLYGSYGGIDSRAGKGVSISGINNATINVFIPTIPINNATYLYLRLAIPMDVSISFGNVTATIS